MLIEQVKSSSDWEDTAIIVTYDDFGGRYDHVPPPEIDRWGPGGRVPMLLISPYARKGFVDHTFYDHTSILKFIEWRYGLEPLAERDAGANNLLPAFDFTQKLPDSGGDTGALPLAALAGLVSIAGAVTFLWRTLRDRRGSRTGRDHRTENRRRGLRKVDPSANRFSETGDAPGIGFSGCLRDAGCWLLVG